MDFQRIIEQIDAAFISPNAMITQLVHEEDHEPYQVWKIQTEKTSYILKEAKGDEVRIYQLLIDVCPDCIPFFYQTVTVEKKTYLLLEYVEGENLCQCNRIKLTATLDALINLQKKTWNMQETAYLKETFDKSLIRRKDRRSYLGDPLLERAYERFMAVYPSVTKAFCHDDLLPFNVIATKHGAVLIDWEIGGFLPYPTPLARLIAHTKEDPNALFYMTEADKRFAIDYYYEKLLKEKGISYQQWLHTVEYFLFYEYCEWVFVGNKYQATDGEYYKEYLPLAKQQATKLLQMEQSPI